MPLFTDVTIQKPESTEKQLFSGEPVIFQFTKKIVYATSGIEVPRYRIFHNRAFCSAQIPQLAVRIQIQIYQVILRLRRSYIDPADQLYFAAEPQSYIIFAFKLRATQYNSA